jgi:hypothetical protein
MLPVAPPWKRWGRRARFAGGTALAAMLTVATETAAARGAVARSCCRWYRRASDRMHRLQL